MGGGRKLHLQVTEFATVVQDSFSFEHTIHYSHVGTYPHFGSHNLSWIATAGHSAGFKLWQCRW